MNLHDAAAVYVGHRAKAEEQYRLKNFDMGLGHKMAAHMVLETYAKGRGITTDEAATDIRRYWPHRKQP